jgi:hypothetical protein
MIALHSDPYTDMAIIPLYMSIHLDNKREVLYVWCASCH